MPDDGSSAACPACLEQEARGWYVKVGEQSIGPLPEDRVREVAASGLLLRQPGSEDWKAATALLADPEFATGSGDGERRHEPAADSVAEPDETDNAGRPTERRPTLLWIGACLLLAAVSGWGALLWYSASARQSRDSAVAALQLERGAALRKVDDRDERLQRRAEDLEAYAGELDERRRLLADVSYRVTMKQAATIEDLQASTRGRRRFRRGRSDFDFESPDVLTDFRKQLAMTWAKELASRDDERNKRRFHEREYAQLEGAPPADPLVLPDSAWFRERNVVYQSRYEELFTAIHKELSLLMRYATADELVRLSRSAKLAFPDRTELPAEFAEAIPVAD